MTRCYSAQQKNFKNTEPRIKHKSRDGKMVNPDIPALILCDSYDGLSRAPSGLRCLK